MPRRARGSLCWDSVKSEVVDLDNEPSSDDDVPKRTVRTTQKAFQQVTLISSDSEDGNLKTPRRNARRQFRIDSDADDDSDDQVQRTSAPKSSNSDTGDNVKARRTAQFRIDSDGSDSDDCVIYSSDEEPTSIVVSKIKQLTLPKFSYDTPDKKTNLKNRKLLKDISNHCGTPLRLSISHETKLPKPNDVNGPAPLRKTTDGKKSGKKAENDKLFDSLLGISYKKTETEDNRNKPNLSPVKIMVLDSYMDTVRSFDKILQKDKGGRNAKKSTESEPNRGSFKKPTPFKKQKEVSSRMKRPGESKIVSRRTDESDSASTDHQISSSVENLTDLPRSLSKLPKPKAPLSWEYEPVDIPSDPEELYAKESPRPPIRKKGKTTSNFCFADLTSALDEIEAQGRLGAQKSFLSSLDSTVDGNLCHPTAQFYKEKFAKKKEELAAVLFRLFNKEVFESKLPDDMAVDWSGRMTSSAGITHLSRKMVGGQWNFLAKITLSKPIVTTADRLRDTLIHEMCHAAVWLVDNKKDGHGPFWKEWTFRARRAFPELRPINTCHSYSKNWKFLWECLSCGYTIGRMTKSFDTTRFSCGRCHGKFELKGDSNKKKREASGFAKFVKENYASVKSAGTAHKDVMKQLSHKYQTEKGNPDQPRKSSEIDDDLDCILVTDEEYLSKQKND